MDPVSTPSKQQRGSQWQRGRLPGTVSQPLPLCGGTCRIQLSHTAWLLSCLRPGALGHSSWLCGIHMTNPASPQIGMCLCVTVVPRLQPGFTKSVFSPRPAFLSALRIGVEHTRRSLSAQYKNAIDCILESIYLIYIPECSY